MMVVTVATLRQSNKSYSHDIFGWDEQQTYSAIQFTRWQHSAVQWGRSTTVLTSWWIALHWQCIILAQRSRTGRWVCIFWVYFSIQHATISVLLNIFANSLDSSTIRTMAASLVTSRLNHANSVLYCIDPCKVYLSPPAYSNYACTRCSR